MQAVKVDVKSTVLLMPAQPMPRAELVVVEVSRLRPKGVDEVKMETQELLDMFSYLQGVTPAGPGQPPMRWPANLGVDFYLTRAPATILGCKVRTACPSSSTLWKSSPVLEIMHKGMLRPIVHVRTIRYSWCIRV